MQTSAGGSSTVGKKKVDRWKNIAVVFCFQDVKLILHLFLRLILNINLSQHKARIFFLNYCH